MAFQRDYKTYTLRDGVNTSTVEKGLSLSSRDAKSHLKNGKRDGRF